MNDETCNAMVFNAQKVLVGNNEDLRYEWSSPGWRRYGLWYYRDGRRCATDGRMAISMEVNGAEHDHPLIHNGLKGLQPPSLQFIEEPLIGGSWHSLDLRTLDIEVLYLDDGPRVLWAGQTLIDSRFLAAILMLPRAEWCFTMMDDEFGPSIRLRESVDHRWHAQVMPIKLKTTHEGLLAEEKKIRDEWIRNRFPDLRPA